MEWSVGAQSIRVMTFNVRGAFHRHDGPNAWERRAGLNLRTIQKAAADLIGFQEFHEPNLELYQRELSGFDHVPGPISESAPPHQYNAIFWRSSELEPLDTGGFWLSETPDVWSASWDTYSIRSAVWVKLRHLPSGACFVHLNTHLDHRSERARVEGARLILSRLESIRDGLPVIITADFNDRPGSTTYRTFLDAGYTDAWSAVGLEERSTYHGFEGSGFLAPDGSLLRIDWILTSAGANGLRPLAVRRIEDAEPPVYPSDHYPVIAELGADQAEFSY